MSEFKKIGLIGRLGDDTIVKTIARLRTYLLAKGLSVLVEEPLAKSFNDDNVAVAHRNQLGEECDMVIVVGGDGSLLGAARDLVHHQVPVLGVNRGRLGFLADVYPNEMEQKVGAVLAGDYTVEQHFLLQAKVLRKGEKLGESMALNDVVLHPGKSTRIMEFELYIDGQFVYHQRSDGLIVSTPTGSTAYSLSAGGPIMHPALDAIVLVPMFPHSLTSRPIVVRGDAKIKLIVGDAKEVFPQISCDSQTHVYASPGDEIHISKMRHQLQLIHPSGHNFYEVCRSKLDWASRLGD